MFRDDIQNRVKIHYIHCTVYIVSSGNTGVDLKALDHLVQRMDRLAALLCPIRPRFLRAHCLEEGGGWWRGDSWETIRHYTGLQGISCGWGEGGEADHRIGTKLCL
jgi:hypothetical protein